MSPIKLRTNMPPREMQRRIEEVKLTPSTRVQGGLEAQIAKSLLQFGEELDVYYNPILLSTGISGGRWLPHFIFGDRRMSGNHLVIDTRPRTRVTHDFLLGVRSAARLHRLYVVLVSNTYADHLHETSGLIVTNYVNSYCEVRNNERGAVESDRLVARLTNRTVRSPYRLMSTLVKRAADVEAAQKVLGADGMRE